MQIRIRIRGIVCTRDAMCHGGRTFENEFRVLELHLRESGPILARIRDKTEFGSV